MRTLPFLIAGFFLLAFVSQFAMAENVNSGSAVMSITPKSKKPSEISGSDWTEEEKAQMRASYEKNCGPLGANQKLPVCSQDEAYRLAGNASSYLGYYFMNYSKFGAANPKSKENLEKLKASMQACLVDKSGNCSSEDRDNIMSALVQHNLGKEIRKMSLINATNQENIKSMPESNMAYDKSLGYSGPTEKVIYKVTPEELDGKVTLNRNTKIEEEKAILGKEFLSEYNTFLDTYTKTTAENEDWHYVAAIPNGGDLQSNLIAKEQNGPNAKIDTETHRIDMNSQSNQRTTQIVEDFKKSIKDPIDSLSVGKDGPKVDYKKFNEDTKLDTLGLSGKHLGAKKEDGTITTGAEAAPAFVADINKAIDQQIAEKQKTLSKGSDGEIASISSYSVSDEAFRKFLDDIWPSSVAKDTSYAPMDAKKP